MAAAHSFVCSWTNSFEPGSPAVLSALFCGGLGTASVLEWQLCYSVWSESRLPYTLCVHILLDPFFIAPLGLQLVRTKWCAGLQLLGPVWAVVLVTEQECWRMVCFQVFLQLLRVAACYS